MTDEAPAQPPQDNDHVAEGCEPFPEPAKSKRPTKPDEATLVLYRQMNNLVGRNVDLMAQDFEKCYLNIGPDDMGAHGMDDHQAQQFTNIMFGAFVNGLITAISPESVFNQKFIQPEMSPKADPGLATVTELSNAAKPEA